MHGIIVTSKYAEAQSEFSPDDLIRLFHDMFSFSIINLNSTPETVNSEDYGCRHSGFTLAMKMYKR